MTIDRDLAKDDKAVHSRIDQLIEVRQMIGLLEKAKRNLNAAILKARQWTPREHRYGHRLSIEYDNVKSIQDDISRRYLSD